MNNLFKSKVVANGKKLREAAAEVDWTPSKMSLVIAEVVEPTWTEKRTLAEFLDCRVADIFPGKNQVVT